jgi:VWFA-related protein
MLPVGLFAQGGNAPLVLRTETRAVQINVLARNKSGDPVRDLTMADFTIFDDNKPRPVQFFSMEGGSAPSGPMPSGFAPAVSVRKQARFTAIVLDALNTEFSDQSYAQDQAMKVVKRMQIDESIAILHLAPGLAMQNFTRDRALLTAAVHRFEPVFPPYAMKKRVQVTIAALKTMADEMTRYGGHKSILWITGGFPDVRVWRSYIEETLRRINQADVAIYPIDTRGLMLGGGSNFDIMNQFAESTGGQAYYNGNDIAGAMDRAIADSKSGYVIGFYLGDNERDRRFHSLRVEVNRPATTLRYRRGYSPNYSPR